MFRLNLTITALSFVACATTKPPKPPPDWATKSCWIEKEGDKLLVYGVGRSDNPEMNPAMSYNNAQNKAFEQVAACIRVDVRTSERAGDNGVTERAIKTFASGTLNAQNLDSYANEHGLILVLARAKLDVPSEPAASPDRTPADAQPSIAPDIEPEVESESPEPSPETTASPLEAAARQSLDENKPKRALRAAKKCLEDEPSDPCPCLKVQAEAHTKLRQARLARRVKKRVLSECPDE